MEKLLTSEQIVSVKEAIQLELRKRGFHAPIIDIEETVNSKRKTHRLEFTSEPFQTTPVLFKEIQVGSFSSNVFCGLSNDPLFNEDVLKVSVGVYAWFKHFSGGNNGCQLFSFYAEFIQRGRKDIIYQVIS